jgi:hypothetical protein
MDFEGWCRRVRRWNPEEDSGGSHSRAAELTSFRRFLDPAIDGSLAPLLENDGFRRRSRRSQEWTKDNRLQVRVLSDSKANDPYSGGAFTLEFEVSKDGRFGHKLAGRVLAEQLLDRRQRVRFVAKRNALAELWGIPPAAHLAVIPECLHEQYLRHFAAVSEVEPQFGMRFRTREEANEWAEFLAHELPTLIARAETLSPRELYLGSAFEW